MTSRRRKNNVMVRLSDAELARLDELRPPDVQRATFLRSLLQEPPSGDEVATRTEALGILTRLARDGRTTAAIALRAGAPRRPGRARGRAREVARR